MHVRRRWAAVLLAGTTLSLGAASVPATASSRAEIMDFGYMPDEFTATVGEEVVWTNTGAYTHSVVADDSQQNAESGQVPPGGTFARSFDEPLSFRYHCKIHPSMKGVVNVVTPPPSTSSTTTTVPPTTTTTRRPPITTTTTSRPPVTTTTQAATAPTERLTTSTTVRVAAGPVPPPPPAAPTLQPKAAVATSDGTAPSVNRESPADRTPPELSRPNQVAAGPLPPLPPGPDGSEAPGDGQALERERPAAESGAGSEVDRQMAFLGGALMAGGAFWLAWQTRRRRH